MGRDKQSLCLNVPPFHTHGGGQNPRQVECGGTEDENRGNSQAQAKRHSFNPTKKLFSFI